MKTDWEQVLQAQIRGVGYSEVVTELRFAPPRLFRFDVALPALMLAIEIDGGCFNGGRHVSTAGIRSEHIKGFLAAALGWTVIHVLPEDVSSGEALRRVQAVLTGQIPDEDLVRKKRAPSKKKRVVGG